MFITAIEYVCKKQQRIILHLTDTCLLLQHVRLTNTVMPALQTVTVSARTQQMSTRCVTTSPACASAARSGRAAGVKLTWTSARPVPTTVRPRTSSVTTLTTASLVPVSATRLKLMGYVLIVQVCD